MADMDGLRYSPDDPYYIQTWACPYENSTLQTHTVFRKKAEEDVGLPGPDTRK